MTDFFCFYTPEPSFLIFSPVTPPLLYYTYLPAIIGSLALGVFVFFASRRSQVGKALLALMGAFVLNCFLDLIVWTHPQASWVMFSWSFFTFTYVLIAALSFHLVYIFIEKKGMPFWLKAVLACFVLVPIVFIGTDYNISGFRLHDCGAYDSPVSVFYDMGFTSLMLMSIIFLGIRRAVKSVDKKQKEQTLIVTMATSVFLLVFMTVMHMTDFLFWTGLVATYEVGLYGVFVIFVFLGLITYLIVHYQAFNVKLIGAQALVWGLWLLISALLFLRDVPTIKVISVITLVLLIGFGVALIRSVKREVEQRRELETLTQKLAEVNAYLKKKVEEQTVEVRAAYEIEKEAKEKLESLDKAKTQFILTTQHHLRTPLTVISATVKMFADRAVGAIFAPADETLIEKANLQTKKMESLIDEFLEISRAGTSQEIMKKERMIPLPLIMEVVDEVREEAARKELILETSFAEDLKYIHVSLHATSFKNALSSIFENAVRYTPEGGRIIVKGNTTRSTLRLVVADTGIGMTRAEQDKAFTAAFERGEEAKAMYTTGKGIGLIVVKSIIETHNGTIKIESRGRGEGTTVTIEIPLIA